MSRAKFIRWGYKTTGFRRFYPDLPHSLLEYHRYDLYFLYQILAPLNEGYNFLRRRLVELIPARLRLYLKRKLYADQIEREAG